jgi:hypothetical protein
VLKNNHPVSTGFNALLIKEMIFMSKANENAAAAIVVFMSGALLGAAAALLLAPASGRETRQRLSGFQDEAVDRLKRYAKEAKYKMGPKGKNKEDFHYDGGDAWI